MTDLQIRDLTPAFGAEVVGLRPSVPLADDVCRELRDRFDDRGLLLFRDLDVDETFQQYLAHMLIGREAPPPAPTPADDAEPARPTYMFVSNKQPGGGAPYGRLMFHCDMMWSEKPHQALSLYGVDVEQPSVPTMFVSSTHAWDSLPDELRTRVADLQVVNGHDTTYPNRGGDDDVIDSVFEEPKMITTAIGHSHPRTDRPVLYVSQQTTREIVGLPHEESEALIDELFSYLYDGSNTYSHDWRNGDLVIWDNLAVQHARSNVLIDGPARTLRKVFAPIPLPVDRAHMPSFSKVGQS